MVGRAQAVPAHRRQLEAELAEHRARPRPSGRGHRRRYGRSGSPCSRLPAGRARPLRRPGPPAPPSAPASAPARRFPAPAAAAPGTAHRPPSAGPLRGPAGSRACAGYRPRRLDPSPPCRRTGRPMAAAMAMPLAHHLHRRLARSRGRRRCPACCGGSARRSARSSRLFSSLPQTSVRISADTLQGRPPALKALGQRHRAVAAAIVRLAEDQLAGPAADHRSTPGSGAEQAA